MSILNPKFILDLIFKIYSGYVKAYINLNFILEWFLVHNYVICRCMHKSKILVDLIHDSYMRYMITYLGQKIILI